ncbi:unnamed protein product [Mucor circinelloides]
MNSNVSSQTLFSNLSTQAITSSEFSLFMGMDNSFVQGASDRCDLYKNSAELMTLVGPITAIRKDEASLSEKKEASSSLGTEKAANEEEQSTSVVEFRMQVLFPSPEKTRVYKREQHQL